MVTSFKDQEKEEVSSFLIGDCVRQPLFNNKQKPLIGIALSRIRGVTKAYNWNSPKQNQG